MKFLLTIICLVIGLFCSGQEILLGKTESQIKSIMQYKSPATLKERTYANNGNVLLGYQFPTDYVSKNRLENMFFTFGDNGTCVNYSMAYYDREPLNDIVNKIKSNPDFVKLENKFTFINLKNSYQVQFKFLDGTDGFEVVYIQKPE